MKKKYKALDEFKNRLLGSELGGRIARLILYGSLLDGTPGEESDIDLLVIAFNPLEEIDRLCSDISFDVMMETGELVEPMVYCIDDYRFPHYFLDRVKEKGKEIYRMNREEERRAEAGDLLDLARKFMRMISKLKDPEDVRGVIDLGYNAIELCLKALLLLKLEEIPKTHTGINRKFGEIYVKEGIVAPEMGRAIRRALEKRNKARYDPHSVITQEDVREVTELGGKIIDLTERQISDAFTGEKI